MHFRPRIHFVRANLFARKGRGGSARLAFALAHSALGLSVACLGLLALLVSTALASADLALKPSAPLP